MLHTDDDMDWRLFFVLIPSSLLVAFFGASVICVAFQALPHVSLTLSLAQAVCWELAHSGGVFLHIASCSSSFLLSPLDAVSINLPFGLGFCFNIVAYTGVATAIPCKTFWLFKALVLSLPP